MPKLCTKVGYRTYERAVVEFSRLKKKRPELKNIYFCIKCDAWHTTKMTKHQMRTRIHG